MDTIGSINKDIRSYLHYYLGCKCHAMGVWEDDYDEPVVPKKIILTGISYDDTVKETWCYFENEEVMYCPIKECFPILRPLSDITEDEMIGLLQSMVPPDMEDKPTKEDYDLEMFYNDGGNMVDGDVAVGANVTCICYIGQIALRQSGDINMFDEDGEPEKVINQPAAFHYLLSKHFDLFGLHEAGLCLYKTDIK